MVKKKNNIQKNEISKDSYKTLEKKASIQITEKKSIFIGYASPVKNEEEAIDFLKNIKEKHIDASHNVYAYIIGQNITRCSDDGEPSGTAGLPVLDVIKKNGITGTIIVVTRYFGGILLGAGNLTRMYSAAAAAVVAEAKIAEYVKYLLFDISCNYSDHGKIEYEVPKFGVVIKNKIFNEDVILSASVKETEFESFNIFLKNLTSGRAAVKLKGTEYGKN